MRGAFPQEDSPPGTQEFEVGKLSGANGLVGSSYLPHLEPISCIYREFYSSGVH
jgi:hypothetical protein